MIYYGRPYPNPKGLLVILLIVALLIAVASCGPHNGKDGTNGTDGTNGQDGTTTIVHEYLPAPEVGKYILMNIEPICGVATTGAEVILTYKNTVTSEIFLLVSFSNNTSGDFTRLSVISIGDYRSTDQFQCRFKVELDANNHLTWKKL